MTQFEYIKKTRSRALQEIRRRQNEMHLRLGDKNVLLGYLCRVLQMTLYGLVCFGSVILSIVGVFRDDKYTIYFMEMDIATQGLDPDQARAYLEKGQSKYKRQLSYGNYTPRQQEKINHTFEYLFSKYPVIKPEVINPQLVKLENIAQESLSKIDSVAEKIDPVSEYAKIRLDKELKEVAAEAKRRKEQEKRQQLIAQSLPDFESKLNDRHISILTECINELQLFLKPLSEKETSNIFTCKLRNPLQIARGKSRLLIYLFVQLFAWNYICIEWQSVCEKNKLFLSSKESKILSSGNISSVANQVNDLPPRNHAIIDNYVNQLKQA